MLRQSRHTLIAVALAALAAPAAGAAQPPACPTGTPGAPVVFPDGVIGVRSGLAVDADGAAASYAPGDHGVSYIADGVDLWEKGHKVDCRGNFKLCRQQWALAEAKAFAKGSPTFCVFAMEVEPLVQGAATVSCGGGRVVAGDGKGRPRLAASVPGVSGPLPVYLSTTTLHQRVDGVTTYVDSASVPGLVAPTTRPDLVGAVAWVRHGAAASFAIVSDTGPRFGEGSIALHQVLRSGAIGPQPPLGPIPTDLRCGAVEMALRAPFKAAPDVGGDVCKRGRQSQGPADIRAKVGIEDGVDMVVLPGVRPPMSGGAVDGAITSAGLSALAVAAGYTTSRLGQMADCLSPNRGGP